MCDNCLIRQWFSRLFTAVVSISFAITLMLCFCYLVTLKNVVFPKFNWLFAVSGYLLSIQFRLATILAILTLLLLFMLRAMTKHFRNDWTGIVIYSDGHDLLIHHRNHSSLDDGEDRLPTGAHVPQQLFGGQLFRDIYCCRSESITRSKICSNYYNFKNLLYNRITVVLYINFRRKT